MEKLSQKELLEEGRFGNMLKGVAKAGVKGLAKTVSPTAYNAVSNVASIIKKNFRSPKQYIESWKKEYPEAIADITDINITDKGPLKVADFKVKLRDPNTKDQVDILVPFHDIAIKEGRSNGEITYTLVGDAKQMDVMLTDLAERYPDTAEAIEAFGAKVLQSQINRSTGEGMDDDGGKEDVKPPELPKETDDKELSPARKALRDARARAHAAMDAAKNSSYDIPQTEEEPPPLPDAEEPPPLPDAEEPPPLPDAEEPSIQPDAEEPSIQPDEVEVIDADTIKTAAASAREPGFKQDKRAIRAVRDYMKNTTVPGYEMTYKDRVERGNAYNPNINGVKIQNSVARAILATESKKSQKSLLKHLQSWSS